MDAGLVDPAEARIFFGSKAAADDPASGEACVMGAEWVEVWGAIRMSQTHQSFHTQSTLDFQ